MKYVIYRNGGYVSDWDRNGGCEWVSRQEGAQRFDSDIGAKMAAEDLDIDDEATRIVDIVENETVYTGKAR